MEEQFVPYELAVELKELGFDEYCFGEYFIIKGSDKVVFETEGEESCSCTMREHGSIIKAPLWQQAFEWFRKKGLSSHIEYWGIFGYYYKIDNKLYGNSKENCGFDYDTAKIECIKTLINIYEYEQTTKNS